MIQDYYKDKTILITGTTGFVGKINISYGNNDNRKGIIREITKVSNRNQNYLFGYQCKGKLFYQMTKLIIGRKQC